MSDADLAEIEDRLNAAERIIPPPWVPLRETQEGIGGGSFIRGGHPDLDHEINVDLNLEGDSVRSPDVRLDVVIEFLGRSAEDIRHLLAEVRRLKAQ
jgi:hypothetical protein